MEQPLEMFLTCTEKQSGLHFPRGSKINLQGTFSLCSATFDLASICHNCRWLFDTHCHTKVRVHRFVVNFFLFCAGSRGVYSNDAREKWDGGDGWGILACGAACWHALERSVNPCVHAFVSLCNILHTFVDTQTCIVARKHADQSKCKFRSLSEHHRVKGIRWLLLLPVTTHSISHSIRHSISHPTMLPSHPRMRPQVV